MEGKVILNSGPLTSWRAAGKVGGKGIWKTARPDAGSLYYWRRNLTLADAADGSSGSGIAAGVPVLSVTCDGNQSGCCRSGLLSELSSEFIAIHVG
jgi:hypothetical protein